jgi:GNAT superfamily N-acetyltransferase
MNEDARIDIRPLALTDAHRFAPLLAAFVQALRRGAPRRPDEHYAEGLLQDPSTVVLGASINGELVGFAIVYDLPDAQSGLRFGQIDHIYVHHDHRSRGIARAMVDLVADGAEDRGWIRLVLNAPRQPEDGRRLYEQIAAPADWSPFVIRFDR